jgi:hypothetical protein
VLSVAAGIALIVFASQTFGKDYPSPVFSIVYASLVIGHFLVPIGRRTSVLYGVLLAIGVISTVFYAVGMLLFNPFLIQIFSIVSVDIK